VTPGERVPDLDTRLQQARDVGWRLLNRRDRTVMEMRRGLADKRVEPAIIEEVVGELCESGYLDDARYAQRFTEDRRRLDSWGADRIERKLRVLGIDPEHIAAALAEQGPAEELQAAVGVLERRFPRPPADPRERDRALGMLVRKGYGLDLAYDALRRHAGAAEMLE
jgi:regulatory protein